jgi:phenylacetate-coenzyme A ligase PaaK-like adenylate-forming protein
MKWAGCCFRVWYQNGLHHWEDHYYAENINPRQKGSQEGRRGNLSTTLREKVMPIIRYRTRISQNSLKKMYLWKDTKKNCTKK